MKAGDALTLAAVAIAVFAVVVATAPLATLGPLLDLGGGEPLPRTSVVIGDIVVRNVDRAHVGALVYTRADATTDALELDVEKYRNRTADLTPPQVRQQVCAVNGTVCDNRTGQEKLLSDLTAAYDEAAHQAGVSATPATTAWMRTREGVLLLTVGEIERPPALPNLSAGLLDVTTELEAACELNGATAEVCDGRYHRFALEVNVSWSLFAHIDGPQANESVLGPLSWSVRTLDAIPGGTSTRVYLPLGAVALVALIVVVLTLAHEYIERRVGPSIVPLAPLAILVGVAVLVWIARHPTGGVLVPCVVGFGALLFAFTLVYRAFDASGVQYYSTKAGLTALGAGVLAFGYGVFTTAQQPLDVLVGELATDGLARSAIRAASYALGAIAGVALVGLVLNVLGSLDARLRGFDLVEKDQLDDLIAAKRVLPPDVDPAVERSVWARAWGRVKRGSYAYWAADTLGYIPKGLYLPEAQLYAWERYRDAVRKARRGAA